MGSMHEIHAPHASVAPAVGADHRSLFVRVATTLAATLELNEVLHRLARLGHEAVGAERSIVFLTEGRELVPEVVAAVQGDDVVLAQIRAMGPVALDDNRWQRLCTGRPLMVEDALRDDLVPSSWREQFSPGAVAMVPLMAERFPSGLLVVDWADPRSFDPEDVALLEALGAYAGLAIRNARDYEAARRRARLQQALSQGAASLVGAGDGSDIADRLTGAYTDLIGARLCAIALLDHQRRAVTTVASRGTAPLPDAFSLDELPRHLVERVMKEWEQAKVPVELPGEPALDRFVGGPEVGASWYLIVPLVVRGHTRGFVLLGFESDRRLDSDERLAMGALADLAGAALERPGLPDPGPHGARSEAWPRAVEEMVRWERERLASDLHDTAGQVFMAIRLMASDAAQRHRDEPERARVFQRFAELAGAGKREIDDAGRALTFLPTVERGLAEALPALAREVASDSGLAIEVDVDPRVGRLGRESERSLYRVAHEALANAWRHAGCSSVKVTLGRAGSDVVLRVDDDGKGPGGAFDEGVGLSGMRRAMYEAGGSLEVGPGPRGGFLVEARAPGTEA